MPFVDEVTVYQGYNSWRIKDRVKVHQIKKEWYKIGAAEVKTEMGNPVYVYDMERTMCDLVRVLKNQDSEIFSKAWHYYMQKESKNIRKLREYSDTFNISDKVEDILEVISYNL